LLILGIDPGYAIVGFGLVESAGGKQRLTACGAINTPAGVRLSARLLQISRDLEDLITRFRLAERRKNLCKDLSKGMQQKLSICCGLLPRPKLVLFDEPMIGLDPHAIKELKKMFVELKEQGCSLLISTHMIDSIEELWDTTYIMKDGKFAAAVTKEETADGTKKLEDIFFEITEGGEDCEPVIEGQEEGKEV